MNTENKPCISPFTFKLEDCLACSACIADFSVPKIPTYTELKDVPLTFLLSPHSKMNMYAHYNNHIMSFSDFEYHLISFIKLKFNVIKVYDTSYVKNILYDSVYEESTRDKIIISDCPGTVSYIERQAHHLIEYLSVTSTQQQAIKLLAQGRSISVIQCYDKFLENSDDVLTTYDFYKMILDLGFLQHNFIKGTCEKWEKCTIGYHYGYLEHILNKKNNYLTKNDSIKIFNSKNEEVRLNGKRKLNINTVTLNKINIPEIDYKYKNGVFTYTQIKNNKKKKYLRILGLEPFLNFIKESKHKELEYDVCEIYICNQGCINGPGQLYTDNLYVNNSEYIDIDLGIDCKQLQKRTYRKIETKKVNFKIEW
ncbi:hypothetical protein NCER_100686 [Vairimorpha ceranae BRL01]|uniref:Iron hydrogenase large subunit C-terminal domain-containing protein n=1 Tax=Vairimorpha ceranae (strain BRL01) TaxID=578460 RepID=C4V878_VAIC1|nr:hypothetical protein NCER_100686 [Vairimorpha ceranae BRL01]